MEFILVWDWVNEETMELYDQHAEFFATKEDLFERKAEVEEIYKYHIGIGRLILSPAVGYSWADMERLF